MRWADEEKRRSVDREDYILPLPLDGRMLQIARFHLTSTSVTFSVTDTVSIKVSWITYLTNA